MSDVRLRSYRVVLVVEDDPLLQAWPWHDPVHEQRAGHATGATSLFPSQSKHTDIGRCLFLRWRSPTKSCTFPQNVLTS